jgi:hypothetical protein
MMAAALRALGSILLLCIIGVAEASAQGHLPGAGLPPHECRASFEQCLNHCIATGGTEGTDNTCAARCSARNCTNGTGGDGSGATADGGGGGRAAGRSCSDLFARCQASCVSKTGNPNCVTIACEHLKAQCVSTGCWHGPAANACGLARQ